MMIQAILSNPSHPEYGVATIPFPIPRDQYAHCMELLADCQGSPVPNHQPFRCVRQVHTGLPPPAPARPRGPVILRLV